MRGKGFAKKQGRGVTIIPGHAVELGFSFFLFLSFPSRKKYIYCSQYSSDLHPPLDTCFSDDRNLHHESRSRDRPSGRVDLGKPEVRGKKPLRGGIPFRKDRA